MSDQSAPSKPFKIDIKTLGYDFKANRDITTIFSDDVVIYGNMVRWLWIEKEGYEEENCLILEYNLHDEFENNIITCQFRYVKPDWPGEDPEIDLSLFGGSLDEAMIRYLTNQYRVNLIMKLNRYEIRKLEFEREQRQD